MNNLSVLRVLIVCGLSMVGGCSGGTEQPQPTTEQPTQAPCSSNIAITVSSGTTPLFTWTPPCSVNRLRVDEVNPVVGASGTDWEVSSPSGQFGSPVRYGTPPDGAAVGVAPASLKTGASYRVTVFRAGAEIVLFSGSTTFTP